MAKKARTYNIYYIINNSMIVASLFVQLDKTVI